MEWSKMHVALGDRKDMAWFFQLYRERISSTFVYVKALLILQLLENLFIDPWRWPYCRTWRLRWTHEAHVPSMVTMLHL